ncbi:4Fe-4S dicluster domain-containing protein [Sulfidibacter corallicola]|uniref:4Fe-4S dicluster domain-containing protein n=1 Tax=Sulfidibacter corallicola TaxID=2818388 RepID=A0A8A4TRV9_SULCO|nr:(Fe-S)-binding protein [Sulfidibacter corallicola]QTD52280.1 4Fe-4S dicluster domain-containing protein [Sulfidibacter corallicola]
MQPIAISFLLLVSLTGFAYLSYLKLSIVRSLQPSVRWDNVGERIKNLVTMGFLQKRMLSGDLKPGLMHFVIFYGFTTLLFRKIQLFIIGFDEFFVYPGTLGGIYAAFKDFIELAVVIALFYAFYRRFVNRPKRLEPNKEAILILSLIATIMITDFLYDGFKFALYAGTNEGIAHEASFAFIGGALGKAFSGFPTHILEIGYHGFYWIQMVVVLSFLVLLPMGEHFHIVTALPALFVSARGPLNKVPSADLSAFFDEDEDDDDDEDEDDEDEFKVGIQTAKDLLWKDGLDVFTCTECGRCKDACPTFLTDKPLSLKWVNDSIKHHLLDHRDTLLKPEADIEEDELPPLIGDIISEDTLWACTTCGYCEAACPIELEHLGKFYRMRQYKVMIDGEVPDELQNAFDNYERASNPWGLNSDTRGDWAEELDVPVVENAEQVKELDYLFYVGSAQSFDSRNQKVAKSFVQILKAAGVKFAILGAEEGSTGECVRRAGNEMLFQMLAMQLVETLNEYEVTKIVTCDPHAYNSLKNEYPEFDGKYEVIHHTQLIDDLLKQGKIKVNADFERVIYHEPCYLGRHNDEYEAPRAIIQRVTKDTPLEFDFNREQSMCCGAGGGRMWMEETIGSRINVTRVDQALTKSPKVIATACPYCTIMLTDGVAHHGKEEEIHTKDIAELVAESLV